MIEDPAPNTITRPYRGLSVQEVDVPLTELDLVPYLLGREVYRRTDYLLLRNGTAAAIVAVRKASTEPLFSPVVEVRVLAGPDEVVFVTEPETDVGNATALARAALANRRAGARAYAVQGRYEHVNFIWEPAPITIRVTEVVPPQPPKLFAMAEQVIAYDEDLPPIELVLDAVDIRELAAEPGGALPAALPRRGSRRRGRGLVPRHPPAGATRLADGRLRAIAAVPPALLRRRAAPGGHLPAATRSAG